MSHALPLLEPKDWLKQGRWFDYQGKRVFFNTKGKGEVILCLHGFPTASWDWHTIWEPLAEHYCLIAPDFLGFGFSDKPKGYPYSILDQASMIEELLDHLGVTACHVLAHDYGDTVAQELLHRHGYQHAKTSHLELLSICFLNGGLFPETHHPLLIQRLFMSPIGALVGKLMSRKKLARSISSIVGTKYELEEVLIDHLWELIQHNNGTAVAHRLIRYMKERVQHRASWVGAMQLSSVPMCLIDGIEDPISGKHMVQRYRQLVPNPIVYELAGVGHFPVLEEPLAVLENFLAYLSSLPARSS